ncbi:4Fe-4S binding protein [Sedimentibacter hydroxybenzoicus DSM 7310]|uniref:4Fe-4S binding protein n=1 Tax=Sedimentibacter hydroxybenzoicus DSM 7310 TaxID=1123245 RepID=A0A974GXE4_SEDHY|nr:EFR1 family ferrodoxin [Sedimentibacter hydroxybenzoicus]NYB75126.1 4Fe-4S binding protein [Sedimentibacter hydroxybenzoicus DSM 7310]
MMGKDMSICSMHFSPTGTTEKIVKKIADTLKDKFEKQDITNIDFTNIKNRQTGQSFSSDNLVVFGVPVIAGRVPNVLLKYLNNVKGNGALAVCVVVYGNRNYDDALIESRDILTDNGFRVIAAGAFIGEHSFSKILAKERPDDEDMSVVKNFSDQIYDKISKGNFDDVKVKGSNPYRDYYRPKDKSGNFVDIRKVAPKTNENCIDCKICAEACPMGSIDFKDVAVLNGICIKCCACIKKCPTEAKYFDDMDYLNHKYELEVQFIKRKEAEIFI